MSVPPSSDTSDNSCSKPFSFSSNLRLPVDGPPPCSLCLCVYAFVSRTRYGISSPRRGRSDTLDAVLQSSRPVPISHSPGNAAALDAALDAALEQLALDHPSPWSTRAAADARAESNKTASEQTARTTYDNTVFTATADFQDAVVGADLLKSDTQTGALGTYQQAQSQAALAKATAQAADNTTAAAAGVGTKKQASENKPPESPEDLPADEYDVARQPFGAGTIIYDGRPSYDQYPYDWCLWDTLDLAVLELGILVGGINQMEWIDHQEATGIHKDRVEEMIQLERG